MTKNKYNSFNELCLNESVNNYNILHKHINDILIFTIHGGKIEFGTSQLVLEIASSDFSFYCFEGLKKNNNFDLHISSLDFDEKILLNILKHTSRSLSIHGFKDSKDIIYIGGKDEEFKNNLYDELILNFNVEKDNIPYNYRGLDENNIVNKTNRNVGVQLEISSEYRLKFFDDIKNNKKDLSDMGISFVKSIRCILNSYTKSF